MVNYCCGRPHLKCFSVSVIVSVAVIAFLHLNQNKSVLRSLITKTENVKSYDLKNQTTPNYGTVIYEKTDTTQITVPNSKPSPVFKQEKYPQISTRYPVSIDQLWAPITKNAQARRVAFYNDRESKTFKSPALLVPTFSDPRIQSAHSLNNMYAKVVYYNDTEICYSKTPGKTLKIRYIPPSRTEFVKEYFLIFELPTKEVPKALLLSEHSDCSSLSSYISVFYEKEDHSKPKLDFIVCLHQPIYSMYNPETVAAWFETNRALGAQKIIVYYQEDIDNINHIVQKYVDEGFVEVFGWYSNFTSRFDNCFGQILLMAECQYRNMYTTKYMVFHDLDELIIPQQDPTWHGMMKTLDSPKKKNSPI